jgi:hypothetical protein
LRPETESGSGAGTRKLPQFLPDRLLCGTLLGRSKEGEFALDHRHQSKERFPVLIVAHTQLSVARRPTNRVPASNIVQVERQSNGLERDGSFFVETACPAPAQAGWDDPCVRAQRAVYGTTATSTRLSAFGRLEPSDSGHQCQPPLCRRQATWPPNAFKRWRNYDLIYAVGAVGQPPRAGRLALLDRATLSAPALSSMTAKKRCQWSGRLIYLIPAPTWSLRHAQPQNLE